ncbi:hypothetical protein ACFYOK_00220 [Microbispora bryophytorum]|uniref:hypothetical protein n=1 Tax=Microbispora TaxID=2005 RepID=UPI0033CDAAF7
MGLRSSAKAAVVATAVATATITLAAQPASAAVTINYAGAQGQFDNNPGRGQSWVWVYAGGDNYSARTDYQFYNGETGSITAYQGQAASKDPGQDIWRIRVCITRWYGTIGSCSNWS